MKYRIICEVDVVEETGDSSDSMLPLAADGSVADPGTLSEYVFRDQKLKRQALTHSSSSGANNEILEFLGDAVLQFVITSVLYDKFAGKYNQGELTSIRTALVKNATLAKIGKLEKLELKTGPSMNSKVISSSMLADAMEAMIGAIYLDAGIEKCHELIISMYNRNNLLETTLPQKSAKNTLQEMLQKEGKKLPEYIVKNNTTKDGKQSFTIECRSAYGTTHATAASINKAEQDAAQKAIDQRSVNNKAKKKKDVAKKMKKAKQE